MKRLKYILLGLFFAFLAVPLAACNGVDDTPALHVDGQNTVLKKGLGVSRYNDKSQASANKFDDLGISWYYNWGVDDPNPYSNAEYVPMIWGAGDVTQTKLDKIKEGYESGKYKHLLTFNEPDKTDMNVSSNVSVAKAIELWPQLESIGIPLSSPAPAEFNIKSFENPQIDNWLDDFMKEAKKKKYRVDFIAVHIYQDFSETGAHNKLRNILTTIYDKYQLPIWLTEFGAIDIGTWAGNPLNSVCNEKAAKEYTQKTTKMLESLGFIERYAWFLDNFTQLGNARPAEGQYTTLYNDDNTISETGKAYKATQSKIPLAFTTKTLENGVKNKTYSQTVQVCGGNGNYSFSCNSMPNGLSISKSGKITGKPKNTGSYMIKINVTDESGQTNYKNFTIEVTAQ